MRMGSYITYQSFRMLTPSLRKLMLTAHIAFSVGWLGAVAVFVIVHLLGGGLGHH